MAASRKSDPVIGSAILSLGAVLTGSLLDRSEVELDHRALVGLFDPDAAGMVD
jgi:hypothetical protein